MFKLDIKKRGVESSSALRDRGEIPAVYYGRKEKTTPISVSRTEFIKIWKKAGESSIVSLSDGPETHDSLIKDVDVDPVTGVARHADFYVIEKGKKLEVDIPINYLGISPAVKDLGGILIKVMHELKIEAEPKDLPHNIDLDISVLTNFDDQILAKDVKLPQGVELVTGPDEVVALISKPVEEKVEEAPVDLSQIEISEKKGKEEKEGEPGSDAEQVSSDKK
ncbi:MAG: hypothetical protein A3G52_03180 [Candidatus Taylorbacteria bacterium RIFCSPLOWO2_12_FULL_43_20]|uniref:Large ribosomal subunit protein bL25 n=1 Tax=Candidatus Taylorbacteria bacterium RIFCSPLOWO2_12_FULL_43_20 TaxID=1802332 RepID=A0A1G2P5D1_9BACT|nr:MAG: hypothetical protein A2825_03665 [Candidatus Taylorbacteria bacterium RIFCSPHIGHO2_01_FULL_43_120]OHA22046.1 MAG: hypothetical protein A3B98_04050 [Candidatus Taylorbacteria bacterium RIFCSPHIGHO2_02_FULL_43_55]OHA30375.1 MAG: hypothetical protein A3E92_00725 [Candidatus Taylorbacteria bacterium RIFCSPHIGHO2_12_FULL_42_34]OHA31543.1 MAG: hypothetical protein A3B09_00770 [Candidatus Taylorbacteria bacterium RIFCSPLOWO2_01_FULL_43_83]OHA39745.1 MAG: hypothetical protein A3H58_04805 [Candi